MGLYAKLVEVSKAVERIPKNGTNAFHGYKYAMEADVSETVRKELAGRGIVFVPSVVSTSHREIQTAKGKTDQLVTVVLTCKFTDAETGETVEFGAAGEGYDSGDKGLYKAITGAVKYALMKFFLIPTGDDPEADHRTDAATAESPSQSRTQQAAAFVGTRQPAAAPAPQARPAAAPAAAPAAQQGGANVFRGTITGVFPRSGTNSRGSWKSLGITVTGLDGQSISASTFNEELQIALNEAFESKSPVDVKWTVNGKYKNVVGVDSVSMDLPGGEEPPF